MKDEISFIKSIIKFDEIINAKINLDSKFYCQPISKANHSNYNFVPQNYFENDSLLFFNLFDVDNKFHGAFFLKFEFENKFQVKKVFIDIDFIDNKILSNNLIRKFCVWLQKYFLAETFIYDKKIIQLKGNVNESMILTAGPSIGIREMIYSSDATLNGWNNEWNKYLKKFENKFSEYVGVKYSIATSSCTGAMQLALMALDIGKGDEVIVPDVTWVSTANVVHAVGANPIFADVDINTWTLDPKSVKLKITKNTKAIMPVHMYGHPANMDAITELAKKHNLKIIEDAAPSIGAEYKGKKTGTFGDFSAFSFQGAKLMVTGEGGMLCTNNEALYKKVYRLWDQGRIPGTFWIEEHGPKYKMSNIQAALGLGQLERIDLMIEKKRQINNWYKSRLNEINDIVFWDESKDVKSICWMTSIRLTKKIKLNREQFCLKLKERNIDSRPVFPSISQYPYWRKKQDSQKNSNIIAKTGINLPSGVCLSKAEVDYICDSIIDIINDDK